MSHHVFDNSYAQPAGLERCAVCGKSREHQAHRSLDQSMQALQKANEVRLIGFQVRRDVKEKRLPLDVALFDMRADSVLVIDLLTSAPGWGVARARDTLDRLRISHLKRCKNLTERQKGLLADIATGQKRDAA